VRARENILIVEDEDEWHGTYRRAAVAQGAGESVSIAKDLATAERLIDATKFAVAFVDVGLDVSDDRNVDGLRVMEKIRETGDETSIVVVTGRSGQDAVTIARDVLKKYNGYDAVAKSTVTPSVLKDLLRGGLQAYREAVVAGGREAARDMLMGGEGALMGGKGGVFWDDQVMRATQFQGTAGRFYDFLANLIGEYLPVIARVSGGAAQVDPAAGLVYGDYWSRAITAAIAVCFGQAKRLDQAIDAARSGSALLDLYQVAAPIKELGSQDVKGAVFLLAEGQREDFGVTPAQRGGQGS